MNVVHSARGAPSGQWLMLTSASGGGFSVLDTFSIAPQCVAHCIYNVTYIIIVFELELKQGVDTDTLKTYRRHQVSNRRANQIKLACAVSHHKTDVDFL